MRDSATAVTIDGASYSLDNAGNRTAKTDQRTAVATSYGYDNIYQLLSATPSSGTPESYTYDPVGNRLSDLTTSGWSNNASNEPLDGVRLGGPFSIHFPTKAIARKAKCRQLNLFQSFIKSFPSFSTWFDFRSSIRNLGTAWVQLRGVNWLSTVRKRRQTKPLEFLICYFGTRRSKVQILSPRPL